MLPEPNNVMWTGLNVIFTSTARHPKNLAAQDIEEFLTHLAAVGKVSASAQNQAKSALLIFYIVRYRKSNYCG
ncbi:phage integrase N-terminal SAM-like domain-containing protein [Candidatus Nitrotoga sp. M5]|uniref:phage integrase N-terminal SAM-like domain-containing protein n=1 Tax=Candidatus Nitrotoga sp. M5 TaxID=2890409 RepID=UPI00403D9C4C